MPCLSWARSYDMLKFDKPPFHLRPLAPNISLSLANAGEDASLNALAWCQVSVLPCVWECARAAGCLSSSLFAVHDQRSSTHARPFIAVQLPTPATRPAPFRAIEDMRHAACPPPSASLRTLHVPHTPKDEVSTYYPPYLSWMVGSSCRECPPFAGRARKAEIRFLRLFVSSYARAPPM
ncbi:hypothetical protein B0H14DRAFT_3520785 [Mycena olivaceomarginata]|nr:hypothetical protein B0H14DRAFT_3520785 [Mycena olivaceomarginata]